MHATYSISIRHPFGTEAQVIAHYDFLRRFRAVERAHEVLDAGLAK